MGSFEAITAHVYDAIRLNRVSMSSFCHTAIAGMSLTYALETLDAAQFGVQLTSETENLMTSVERVVTFTQMSPEPGYDTKDERRPAKGNLSLRNLSLRYVEGSHRALRDVTLEIKDKEKVGVTGRTGSGKSSLLAALFRMPEPDGKVRLTVRHRCLYGGVRIL